MYFTYIFLVTMLQMVNCQTEENNVAFVATLFRHGDRTPISFYPNDPWSDRKWWPVNFGQLTEKGMLQHFNLGLKYRKNYGHLLSNSYDSMELYVRSTDYDRTIMSALSNLAGLYSPNITDEFTPGLAWKPVPVRTIPAYVDDVLGMKAPCPRYDWEKAKFIKSKHYQDVYNEYQSVFQYLTHHTGKAILTLTDASYVYDVLFIEESYNFTLPNWTASVYPDTLKNISKYSFEFETFTPEMKRLKSGPLIKEIIGFMDGVVNNISTWKFAMYSAHDTTIAAILNSLSMFNEQLPPYAAHMVFELLLPDEEVPEHKIRIKYQDEVLEIPDCGKTCTLSQFKEIYKWLIPEDHDSDCQLKMYRTRDNIYELVSSISAILIVFCLISIAVIKLRSQASPKYLPCANGHEIYPSDPTK